MKSEHRHELQENELTKYADVSLAWLKSYGNVIMIVICVVSIGASILIYNQRVSRSRIEHAWGEMAAARTAADFSSITSDPNLVKTSAGQWAMIQAAEHRLEDGIKLMFTDRERGKRELSTGREEFEAVLAVKPVVDPQIRQRALFGLARAQESLSDGKDLNTAIATYEKLIQEFPDTILKKPAEERIEELKRKGSEAFYAWFSKQNPTTATNRAPADQKTSENAKKGTSTATSTATTTSEPATILVPDNSPLPDVPGKTKAPLPSSTGDDLPPQKTPEPKASDKKGAAEKEPAKPELPALPAPKKEGSVKSEVPALPVPAAKPEPAKSEPATKTDAKPDPASKKSP